MSAGWNPLLMISGLLILALAVTGCTTAQIGDVAFRNGEIYIDIANSGEAGDAFVQVTVYEIWNLHQQELTALQEPVNLRQGKNTVRIPCNLTSGTYKLYVYILRQDERTTATIRDITI